jgi:hypothetical protein
MSTCAILLPEAQPSNKAAFNFVYICCKQPFLDREFKEYLRENDQEIHVYEEMKGGTANTVT